MRIHSNREDHNIYGYVSMYISQKSWIDKNVEVGEGSKVYHFTVLRENVKIGDNTVIGHNVVVERDTVIGDNCTIQSQCHITAEAEIGNNVFFGPSVVTMNERNIANQGRTTPKIEKLVIHDGARIGAGAILAPGITIGKNAFIHAGVFLTKDVPAGTVWGHRNGFATAKYIGQVPKEEWL